MPPLVVLFCKIPISIPLKSETVFTGILRSGIRYGAGTGVQPYLLPIQPRRMKGVGENVGHRDIFRA